LLPSRRHASDMFPPSVQRASTGALVVRLSLGDDPAATLLRAFVTSRIDYCNAVLAAALKVITDKMQRVLNAAAHVLSGTRKYDRGLSRLLHTSSYIGVKFLTALTTSSVSCCYDACTVRHQHTCT